MKKNITKLTAYEIGIQLEKKKIDPISLLELFLENYNLAEEDTKRGVSKILKKEPFSEAKLTWERQKNNNRLSIFDGVPSGWKDVINIKNYPAFAGSKLLKKLEDYYYN